MAKEEDAGIVEQVVKKALKAGATDSVAIINRSASNQVKFANSEIATLQSWLDTSLDIYMVFGKKVLSSSITDLTTIDATIELLRKNSARASENEDYKGIAEGKYKYRKSPPDKKIIDAEEKLVDLTWKGILAAEKAGADRAAGTLHRYHTWSTMRSSRGPSFEEEGASVAFSIRAFNKESGSAHMSGCATKLADFNPAEPGKEAGELCKLVRKPQTGPEGKLKVLFTPMSAADIVMHVVRFASASSVESGMSFLKDKIGMDVGSPMVNLYDDGTLDEGLGSRCADDEGIPTQKTQIMKEGKLLSYLHNTSTGAKFDAKSTGNAGLMFPHPWNCVMESGDMKYDELLEDMGDGLIVTNVWYTRFQNYFTGDYSTIPRDAILKVERGEVVGAVKGIRVTDNMGRILKGVCGLGKEQRQIYWWEIETPTFVPHVLVKDVGITKSTM